MKKITIYTTSVCPHCVKAKTLLNQKGLKYEEINVEDPTEREKLLKKANGMRTVPQIFIGNHHVGGCDDLYEYDETGELEKLLS